MNAKHECPQERRSAVDPQGTEEEEHEHSVGRVVDQIHQLCNPGLWSRLRSQECLIRHQTQKVERPVVGDPRIAEMNVRDNFPRSFPTRCPNGGDVLRIVPIAELLGNNSADNCRDYRDDQDY